MLQKEYEELVHYIEGMIADGCQIVIGGNLVDWEDTNVPELLEKIRKKKQGAANKKLKAGDLLSNRVSGQRFAVISDDGKTVFLTATKPTIEYPSDRILEDFEKVED